MKFLANRTLVARIGIITTIIFFGGILLLWRTVSRRVTAIVENDITNQMIDAAEKSVALSNQLSDQSKTLNYLISRFRIQ